MVPGSAEKSVKERKECWRGFGERWEVVVGD